jgi:hypothetical protein
MPRPSKPVERRSLLALRRVPPRASRQREMRKVEKGEGFPLRPIYQAGRGILSFWMLVAIPFFEARTFHSLF